MKDYLYRTIFKGFVVFAAVAALAIIFHILHEALGFTGMTAFYLSPYPVGKSASAGLPILENLWVSWAESPGGYIFYVFALIALFTLCAYIIYWLALSIIKLFTLKKTV